MTDIVHPDNLPAVVRLSRDVLDASRQLKDREARFLVDSYYAMQDARIAWAARVRQSGEEPAAVLRWLEEQNETLEGQIKRALDRYSAAHPVGEWMRSVVGIGPVIAAGLLAHIDINRAPTCGAIWAFAGLANKPWEKGQKRPWNPSLKTLCAFKLGESFVKTQNHPDGFYGREFVAAKRIQWQHNLAGDFRQIAEETKAKFKKDTDAFKWRDGRFAGADLEASPIKGVPPEAGAAGLPMLPPAAIHARARRAAVKLFLSHLFEVWHYYEHGTPGPRPYVFEHMGHTHYIPPPGWVPFTKAA